MLDGMVGEYRRRLKLDKMPAVPVSKDQLAFLFWTILSVIVYLIAVSPIWLTIVLIGLLIFWR